ncbi:GNAT family N-acetyltransferase [Flavobacterium sp. PLA-1-15]|uniref:GNAT family N-acetyltransferase n=1 Tax=Flavobacterium sp. PLA-1-15 TaxID=3380533 RepID=UPI003B8225AA
MKTTCLLKRTSSTDTDFQKLVIALDKELAIRDGEEHSFFAQYNTTTLIKHVVLFYENELPIGCGAIKEYDPATMEIKRMFVPLAERGKGIASRVLQELEKWAKELGYQKCILETGIKQPEAIGLYKKNGYSIIQNYEPYTAVESSVCFEKVLIAPLS